MKIQNGVKSDIVESIYEKNWPNPKKIATKGFLTDSGR